MVIQMWIKKIYIIILKLFEKRTNNIYNYSNQYSVLPQKYLSVWASYLILWKI